MRTWLAAVSVAALGVAAPCADAQQTSTVAPAADAPTQVVVTAKADDPRKSTASKTVVGRDELQRHGDTTMGDALKRVPGVSVDGDGNIGLRGMGSGYTQVLLNGEPPPPGFSVTGLAPDAVERIEIIRTPTADMRGDGIAGTINIILRKAVHKRTREFKAGTSQGKGRPGVILSGGLGDHVGHLSWVVNASLTHLDDVQTDSQRTTSVDTAGHAYDVTDLSEVYRLRTEGFSLTPSVTWTGEKGDTTTLTGLADLSHRPIFRGQTSRTELGAPLPYADNPQNIVYDARLGRFDLEHSRKLTERVSLKLKASASTFHRGGFVHQTGHDALGDLILDDTIVSTADERSASTSGALALEVFHDHTLDFGWDGSDDSRSERRTEVNQPLPGALTGDSDDLFTSAVRRAAVYVQDNWTIGETWSAYLGLRQEQMDTFSHGTTYARIHNRIRATSPVVQALWKPGGTGADQVRLAISRTFKAPGISALVPRPYVSYNNTEFTPDGVGNPDLKPELAWGLDASYEHDWKGGAMWSVNAFHRDISGVILYQTRLVAGRWITTPINSGKARVSGLTVEGKAAWLGADWHGSVTGNASRVESLSGPGNVVADQPPAQVNLDVERPLGKLWRVGGSYVFVRGLLAQSSATQWTKGSDTHALDAYALRTLSPHWRLRLAADGLIRRMGRSLSIYEDAAGRAYGEGLAPGITTVHANLEFKE